MSRGKYGNVLRKLFFIWIKKKACEEVANLEFWIKQFVPTRFANTLKHIRYLISDKKS